MIHVKIEDGRPINLYNNQRCNCGKLCEKTTTCTIFEDGRPVKIHEVEYKDCNCGGGCKNCSCGKTKESEGDE